MQNVSELFAHFKSVRVIMQILKIKAYKKNVLLHIS